MSAARPVFGVVALVVALALQISLLPHAAWNGVVPNLVLLVVVAAALTCSPRQSLLLAFTGGAMLDLVPPADHYAGRWALALVLVAWCVQASRQGTRPGFGQTFVTAAAASFVASSLFALSGLLLGDPEVGVGALLQTIMATLAWDVVLTPLVVPVTMVAFRRLARDGAGREFERERI